MASANGLAASRIPLALSPLFPSHHPRRAGHRTSLVGPRKDLLIWPPTQNTGQCRASARVGRALGSGERTREPYLLSGNNCRRKRRSVPFYPMLRVNSKPFRLSSAKNIADGALPTCSRIERGASRYSELHHALEKAFAVRENELIVSEAGPAT